MDEFNIEGLQEQAAQMQQQLEELKEMLAPIDEAATELNAEYYVLQENYRKSLDALNKKRHDLDEKKYEATKAINQQTSVIQAIQNKIAEWELAQQAEAEAKIAAEKAAQELAEQQAANKALKERWDLLTIKAPWREWAKDHQIDGAHFITENRNVIVADPMGLGKTLTAIAATDMVYAASEHASVEEPWLGEEQEIWVPAKTVWTEKGIMAFLHGELPESYDAVRRLSLKNQSATDPQTMLKEVGQQVSGYLPFDARKKFETEGWTENIEGHNEKKIINTIQRPVGRRILYLCPSSLQRNVLQEWRMWASHRNVIFIGGMSKAERAFALDMLEQTKPDNLVLICNYEAWRRDWALVERFTDMHFDTLIIDEAHNAKERKTNVNKGITHILDNARPEYVIPMTGTPVLNRPQELFTLLHMVDPVRFHTENSFLFSYCEQDEMGFWKFRPGGLEQLAKMISKNFLRRTKDQAGIQLPEKTIILHEIEVDEDAYPGQAKARKQMRDFATIMMQNSTKGGKALAATVKIAVITRLRQIETWPAGIVAKDPKTKEITFQLDVEESQKIDYIIRQSEDGLWDGIIPEAISDERIVLFSQFKAPIREIKRRVELSGYRAVILDGDTPQEERNLITRDFDTRHTPDRGSSKWDIVLCNYRAGGVGLNFTAASQLIVLDEAWNPGNRDQAYGRIDRIGQTKAMTIHVVRNSPTIDDWLGNIMDNKEALVDGFEKATTSALDDFQSAFESGLI